MTILVACLLVLADPVDEVHLAKRLDALAEGYRGQVRRQSPEAIGIRVGALREIRHLPWTGGARVAVGRFLAQAVTQDRSYRVRAEAIRAIGRVGTPAALEAMYRAVFDRNGRSPRFALLDSTIPYALALLRDPNDWLWLERHILAPRESNSYFRLAGHRGDEMIAFTIEAFGRGNRTSAAATIRRFASDPNTLVRAAAIRALGRLRSAPDLVSAALRDDDEDVRLSAARAESLPFTQLQSVLQAPSVFMRRAGLRNLDTRGDAVALPILLRRLRVESVHAARLDIHTMLVRRTDRDFGMDPELWSNWHAAKRREDAGTRANTVRPARSVLFLVDVSASMNRVAVGGRTRQQQAVEAMRHYMGTTHRAARYAALAYASDLRRFPERVSAAKPSEVLLWFDGLKPAGASNSYAALMQALRDPLRPETIVFISDGVPRHCTWRGKTYNEPEQILYEVRRANRKALIRIDTIGLIGGAPKGDYLIDEEAATGFLRALAAEHGGRYRELR